jgi:hypothetical protein
VVWQKENGASAVLSEFSGVTADIYKTPVRSLYLIYIAVLARAELRDLLVTYSDILLVLPTSALGVISHRSEETARDFRSPYCIYIITYLKGFVNDFFVFIL